MWLGMSDVASTSDDTEHAAAHQTRRALLVTALAGCACLAANRPVGADEDQPGSDERPQKDDLLVVTDGPQSGQVIKPSDLKQGGPPAEKLLATDLAILRKALTAEQQRDAEAAAHAWLDAHPNQDDYQTK